MVENRRKFGDLEDVYNFFGFSLLANATGENAFHTLELLFNFHFFQ